MKIFSIYKATNKVNGKIYIGFDSNWPRRFNDHKRDNKKENSAHYNCIFHRAIRKYGWEAFEWEVICQSLDGEYLLKEMEPYFIQYYKSFGYKGYNMTLGGEGSLGYKASKATKEKISKSKKGITRIITEEHRQNIIKAAKKDKRKPPSRLNTKHSSISISKMSISHRNNPKSAKNWLLIDPDGNEHIILNLEKFCRDNIQFNLNYNGMLVALCKKKNTLKRNYYKGWIINNIN